MVSSFKISLLLLLVPAAALAQSETQTVVSFNARTEIGRENRDSVFAAMLRIGLRYDTIDRNIDTGAIDYTKWMTAIWASGDPSIPVVSDEPTAQAGFSRKEVLELTRFLAAGTQSGKSGLIVAGANIARENDSLLPNGAADSIFMRSWLHVKYVANGPEVQGWIAGDDPAYWNFEDSISSNYCNVVAPVLQTALVGPVVNTFASSYAPHAIMERDTGAGVTFYDSTTNVVFFGFDWRDPKQTRSGEGIRTSGITRILNGALQFDQSHGPFPRRRLQVKTLKDGFSVRLLSSGLLELEELPVNTKWITLFNILGKELLALRAPFPSVLNLREIPRGIYFIRASSPSGIFLKVFIKN